MKKIIFIIILLLSISSIHSQSVMNANKSKTNYKPLKSELLTSSQTSYYKFYDPFRWGKLNSSFDKFSYDKKNHRLFFTITQIGQTSSVEESLYIVIRGVDVNYITVQDGYSSTKRQIVKTEDLTLPSNTVMDAISSVSGANNEADVFFKAYKLGVKKWGKNIIVEINLKKEIKNDIIITAIAENPNKFDRLTYESARLAYGTINTIVRLLGESNNTHMSFVNHKVIYSTETSANKTNTKLVFFTDKRDGKKYKTVKIGNQVWMAENLAYKTTSGSWAYNNKQSNVTKYGRLYNWETAKKVCPSGWHLPDKEEFETLLDNFGGKGETAYKALITSGSSSFSALQTGFRSSNGSLSKNL